MNDVWSVFLFWEGLGVVLLQWGAHPCPFSPWAPKGPWNSPGETPSSLIEVKYNLYTYLQSISRLETASLLLPHQIKAGKNRFQTVFLELEHLLEIFFYFHLFSNHHDRHGCFVCVAAAALTRPLLVLSALQGGADRSTHVISMDASLPPSVFPSL